MECIIKLDEYMQPTNPYTRLETLLAEHGFEFNYCKDHCEIELRLFQNRVMRFRITLEIPDAYQWMIPYPEQLTAEEWTRHRNDTEWFPTMSLSEKFGEAHDEFTRYRLHQLCDVIEAHLESGNSLPDVFPADHYLFSEYKILYPSVP